MRGLTHPLQDCAPPHIQPGEAVLNDDQSLQEGRGTRASKCVCALATMTTSRSDVGQHTRAVHPLSHSHTHLVLEAPAGCDALEEAQLGLQLLAPGLKQHTPVLHTSTHGKA
jgi:hypothetical protein